ncbi:hypothetical protein AB3M94_19730 [Peribacillus frigoritolerans]
MGWYKDDEYKEKFTDDVFTESLTLYAKWEKVDKVITKSVIFSVRSSILLSL